MSNVYANKYSLSEIANACGLTIEELSKATPARLASLAEAIGNVKNSELALKQQIILAKTGA